jgi:hypothetical protein
MARSHDTVPSVSSTVRDSSARDISAVCSAGTAVLIFTDAGTHRPPVRALNS